MLSGESVTIWRPTTTLDERKDPVTEWTDETLDNVLFDQPRTEDMDAIMRMYGVVVHYRMHVPKAYTATLRGCRVERANGDTYDVIGDPQPLQWSPLDWDREAMLVMRDG